MFSSLFPLRNIAHQHICEIFPLCHLFAIHLMIIMWKDQLITHRVSDLNEWNAENIERKIQLHAKLKRKKSQSKSRKKNN